jgi:pyruvate dehydrogenase E1 component alpha subunit
MRDRNPSTRKSAKSFRAKTQVGSARKRSSSTRKPVKARVRSTVGLALPVSGASCLLDFYRAMMRIRMVEEAIVAHYGEAEMRCPVHLSIGQEAAAVGSCQALATTDKVFSTHRCHAHYLAKGGDLRRMLAEIYGKAAGCVGGRGGSMHLMDIEKGVVASVPIVGSSIALAGGSALADKRTGRNHVTAAYFGDASVEEGVFHETANLAALHKLPIVFVCENNLFSVYTPLRERQPSRPLTDLAEAHGIATRHGDGNDVVEVHRMTKAAVDRARKGRGPAFLLFDTYRWREHCGPNYDNAIGYRTEAEFGRWKKRDPIGRLARQLRAAGQLSVEREAEITAEIAAEIAAAIEFARSAPLPTPDQAALHVYA